METLVANEIRKSFGQLSVLKGISLSISKGEIVAITGRSGAGKSTLLHILGTLDQPDSGEIFIADKQTTLLKGSDLAKFRNEHIGFVFQFHHLLPEFTALENVAIPALLKGDPKILAYDKAAELLDYFGLSDRSEHKPGQLSGGEQQRVAVARALINKPSVILADEPTGNLDNSSANHLMKLFKDLQARFNHTFVIVTHSTELASQSDRIIQLQDGKIV